MRLERRLTLKGQLTASEDVTLDFAVEGAIDLSGHVLVIAESAHVDATITAAVVIVHGRLDGHVTADRVTLAPTALVDASIVAPRFAVSDGARFKGPVNSDRAHAAGSVARHRQKAAADA